MKKNSTIAYAFTKSLPVLFGYLFLGIGFGILFQQQGYGAPWAGLAALLMYAGSGQYALVSFVASGASFVTMGLMTLFINARHIFYGISFVDEFKKSKAYPYLIFSLTDETYSVFCLCQGEEKLHANNNKAMFFIALFDQIYWICGCIIGALMGQLIPFDFTGIDFAMTALFVVILVDRLKGAKNDKNSMYAAIIGLACGLVCLLIFGVDFILPAMIVTVVALLIQANLQKEAKAE